MNPDPLFVLAVMGAACWGISVIQAVEHRQIIRHGWMTHAVKKEWALVRLFLLSALAGVSWGSGLVTWWCAGALVIGGLGLFSYLFRERLNRSMGWDRNYLGVTATYDLLLISVVVLWEDLHWPSWEALRITHWVSYRRSATYHATVQRAGKLATWIELITASLAVLCCLYSSFKP
jgi:hypothetical protein